MVSPSPLFSVVYICIKKENENDIKYTHVNETKVMINGRSSKLNGIKTFSSGQLIKSIMVT